MYCKINEKAYNNKIIFRIVSFVNLIILGGKKCLIKAKMQSKLAVTLLCELCTSLFDFIKKIIISKNFISHHKRSSKDFSRNRTLPFSIMALFLMNLLKSSIQNELDNFFKAINKYDITERRVTASAFCQARKKFIKVKFGYGIKNPLGL